MLLIVWNDTIKIDLSSNATDKLTKCDDCGNFNPRNDRIDTEDIFGIFVSYCIPCWYGHFTKKNPRNFFLEKEEE